MSKDREGEDRESLITYIYTCTCSSDTYFHLSYNLSTEVTRQKTHTYAHCAFMCVNLETAQM